LNEARHEFSRRATIKTVNLSVNQLLRRAVRQGSLELAGDFDLIYCGGLFDYLSAHTCTELVSLFHQNLQPGGLVLVANMNDAKPFRHFIEFVLDWQLIYRQPRDLEDFTPDHLRETAATVVAEPTSVNLFLHLRKPE
jgi:extracellular factor (EF) 3-hydroxypalmitic acid methyl ester biosynthesis protein